MKIHLDFADFIAILNRNRVEYVIVGAYAMAFLGVPRYTGDVDIWVRPTGSNAEALLCAIKGFGFESLTLTERDILSGKVIQMGCPPVRIDLLTRLDGLKTEEIWDSRQKGPFGDDVVYYIGKDALIRNKRATGRKKDIVDLAILDESEGA